jgi:hypothetical protein
MNTICSGIMGLSVGLFCRRASLVPMMRKSMPPKIMPVTSKNQKYFTNFIAKC